jgi:hypothetical protein
MSYVRSAKLAENLLKFGAGHYSGDCSVFKEARHLSGSPSISIWILPIGKKIQSFFIGNA